ncbi:MAG: DUF362 domain-containing protein [Desulfobacterales bacterium]|jgi:hypothetical protein
MSRHVQPGQNVIIKPNMSFAGGPEDATDTHPEVVPELMALCRQAGAQRVRVLDYTLRREEGCIEGVQKASKVHGDDIGQAVSGNRFLESAAIADGRHTRPPLDEGDAASELPPGFAEYIWRETLIDWGSAVASRPSG